MIFRAVSGEKGQKWPKMKSNYICHAPYLRNSIACDHDFWCTIVKWWYIPGAFFHFFKILIFWVVGGTNVQKIVQNDKTFCPSCCISQEPYIIWLPFMVHMCKMISPGVFSFFQNFDFLGCKRAKNDLNYQFH